MQESQDEGLLLDLLSLRFSAHGSASGAVSLSSWPQNKITVDYDLKSSNYRESSYTKGDVRED